MKKLRGIVMILLVSIMLTGCIGNPYKTGIKSLEDGEYSKAAESFEEAIAEEKNLADAYRGLGISLWEEKDYEGACAAFEKALLNGSKETATIFSLMGNCSMRTENYEKAIEYYEMALSMDDISEELLKEVEYNMVAAYEYAGNVEMAKEACAAYIEKYPDDEAMVREAGFLETR